MKMWWITVYRLHEIVSDHSDRRSANRAALTQYVLVQLLTCVASPWHVSCWCGDVVGDCCSHVLLRHWQANVVSGAGTVQRCHDDHSDQPPSTARAVLQHQSTPYRSKPRTIFYILRTLHDVPVWLWWRCEQEYCAFPRAEHLLCRSFHEQYGSWRPMHCLYGNKYAIHSGENHAGFISHM